MYGNILLNQPIGNVCKILPPENAYSNLLNRNTSSILAFFAAFCRNH